MQTAVETLGLGKRYGYAAIAMKAKFETWAEVVAGDRKNQELVPDLAPIIQKAFMVAQPSLNAVKPVPFLHDTTTKNVIINEDNTLSGIVDVDDLCWGDRRFTKALTLVAMLADGYDSWYVDQWMQQAGDEQDCLFDFYVAHHAFSFLGEAMRPLGNGNPSSQEPERMAILRQLVKDRCAAVVKEI
jgi:Ser/Thr protein kinase RdoA (MazF antagonist)